MDAGSEVTYSRPCAWSYCMYYQTDLLLSRLERGGGVKWRSDFSWWVEFSSRHPFPIRSTKSLVTRAEPGHDRLRGGGP